MHQESGTTNLSVGPYAGVRVVELSSREVADTAIAFAGMLLADRGAEVIKVHDASAEPTLPPTTNATAQDVPTDRAWLDRGKRSLSLAPLRAAGDARADAALAILQRLLTTADVLLTNLPLPELRALALDEAQLRVRWPHLLLVRNSGFGDAGPSSTVPGHDLLLQARSGLLAGEQKLRADGCTPARLQATRFTAFPTAVMLSMAISAGLRMRAASGIGQEALVSEFALALALQMVRSTDNPVADRLRAASQQKLAAARAAGSDWASLCAARADLNLPPGNIFYRAFRTADGAVFVGALSRPLRDKLRRVLASDHLYRDDPNFDPDNPEYLARCTAVERDIEALFRSNSTAEWIARCESAGVPIGEVTAVHQLVQHPQAAANDYLVSVQDPHDGPLLQAAEPVQFGRWPARVPRGAAVLGADTAAILHALGPGSADASGEVR